MSRRLLAFLLSELKTVRIICQHPSCGAVTEMTVEAMATRFKGRTAECPVCQSQFAGVAGGMPGEDNALFKLAAGILASQGAGKATPPGVEVEFVLPDPAAR